MYVKIPSVLICAIIASLVLASTALADRFTSTEAKGIYIGFGIGTASTRHGYEQMFTNNDRITSGLMNVRYGFIVHKNVLLGLDTGIDFFERGSTDWQMQYGVLSVTLYPSDNFFLKGGPCFGRIGYTYNSYGPFDNEVYAFGYGLQLGIGADLRLSNHWSLTPTAQYTFMDFDEFSSDAIGGIIEITRFW